ncbi:hypothetical protein CWE15_11750 [Aliidiomarina taiwanensis]|uniref:DUF4329 domain-containing protein n=1 Tax=Aliidiomarina taiwanensis TaxID=946228 RepID=A0A432WTH1_9GAMM|nr:RHS repeat-associated core domain-containing protein [Aliidiomarina taiwanensis]RUO37075.1 hypothetical protein CWE15_11750 [Aliidiomarina taiwanensis]
MLPIYPLEVIIQGHGIRTQIYYSSLSNPNIYQRRNSSQQDNGEFALYAGYSVVGTVRREIADGNFAKVFYRYGGLLVSRQGRGLLGFEFITSEDISTNIATQTRYAQQFPFIGMPLASKTLDLEGNFPLSYAKNTLSVRANGPAGSRHPYVSQSEEYSYAIQRTDGGTITGSVPQTRVHSSFSHDIYGNLLQSTTTTSGFTANGSATSHRTVVTTQNQYFSTKGLLNLGGENKRFGRLSKSTVQTSLTDSNGTNSMTREANFTYQSNGLLETESVTLSGQSQSLVTTYSYDIAGNVIEKSSIPTPGAAPSGARTTRNVYDALFNRVMQRTNAEGLITQLAYTESFGHTVKITSTGMNNEKSHVYFDTFGREHRSAVSFGTGGEIIQQERVWAACGPCGVTGAVSKLTITGAGKPTQSVYVDRFGREIRSERQLLTGSVSHVRTTYDALGRPSRVYEPSTSVGNRYVQYYYDRHGDVFKTRAPNGGFSTVARSGLSTVTKDAYSRATTSVHDYAGRVVEVKDSANDSLLYSYHPSGQVAVVRSRVGTQTVVRVTNTYDADGRRTAMHDAEKGTWEYKYNAFGELIEQKDAPNPNGTRNKITMEYDRLGRVVREVHAAASGVASEASTVCHKYAPAHSTTANAKGRLIEVVRFTRVRECSTSATPTYHEHYTYNAQGLMSRKVVFNNGEDATFDYTYDSFLRPRLTRYPNRSGLSRLVVERIYQNGHFKGYRNQATGNMIEQVTQVDARGNGTRVLFQNGAETLYSYHESTGWLSGVSVNHNGLIRSIDYAYDLVGNLSLREQRFRSGTGTDVNESFIYDNRYRLKQYNLDVVSGGTNPPPDPDPDPDPDPKPCPPGLICTGPTDPPPPGGIELFATANSNYSTMSGSAMVAIYTYDGHGNILTKGDVGTNGATFSYGASGRPTRLTSVSSSHGNKTFTYDANGNVTSDGTNQFIYTTFDKPIEVRRSSNFRTLFTYGPNRTLVYQEDIRGNDTKQRWIFGGYERVKLENNDIEHRFMVGGTVVTHTDYHGTTTSTERVTHLHKDAQGSTMVITGNAVSGNVLKQQLAYDPWGKQSTLWSHNQFVLGKYLGEMRGYTGHTMVNDMDVIHMGGRTYNPVLGRFMQADPFIQAGTNLQNYNRYSYVLNNPLSYTDPSGYFFKKLSTTFGRFTPLLSIAIMVIPGAQPMGATMLKGFFAGGIATGNLRGAIVGGLTAGMGKSLGGLKGVGGFMSRGIVGGAASSVQGGKFSHGFVSAGASSLGGNAGSPTGNILMSAMVGGTVSHLVGGKFANGAVSGAMTAIFISGEQSSQISGKSGDGEAASEFPESRMLTNTDHDWIPEDGYETIDAAAEAGLGYAKSIGNENTEYGGGIVKVGERFWFSEAVTTGQGAAFGATVVIPKGGSLVGMYHTHPSGSASLLFSQHDVRFAESTGLRSYVGNYQDNAIRYYDPSSMSPSSIRYQGSRLRGVSKGAILCEQCF